MFQINDLSIFLLRAAVGLIFLIHGTQKWKMWKMQPSEQMPAKMISMMKMLSVAEPLAGLLLISGIFIQWAAIALAVIMIGAIYFKVLVWKKKFTEVGGWEFDLLLLIASLAILFSR